MHFSPSARILLLACVVLAMGPLTLVQARPYRPADDSEILQKLPTRLFGPSPGRERALRKLIAERPNAMDLALRLAEIEVRRSRSTSDPRPLGRAEALLAPWWQAVNPPVPVLMLRATIRQRSHEFAPALADLGQIVEREPRNAQAWLMLAAIEQVTGNLEAAAHACAQLDGLAVPLATQACKSSLDGIRGRASKAYRSLQAALAQDTRRDQPDLRNWALTLQAELAERLDQPELAERLFRQRLAADPADAYSTAAFADFLLDENRPQEVARLIDANTPVDTLLLRRAQAARRMGSTQASALIAELDARFAALRARGDRVHLREEARFRLELGDDPQGALELAEANWRVQKEPLDARILLECALAARQPEAASDVVRWVAETGLEGPILATLVSKAGQP